LKDNTGAIADFTKAIEMIPQRWKHILPGELKKLHWIKESACLILKRQET
jgi:hypothetical protein